MKKHHFIGEFELHKGFFVIGDKETVHQIKNVLKFDPGESIILCDGNGTEAEAEIKAVKKNGVEVEIISVKKGSGDTNANITLYCSILKRENFEWAAQKATEVGVSLIVPLVSARTVKKDINAGRLKKIMKEAAEQAERVTLPAIEDPTSFSKALHESRGNDINFLFDRIGKKIDNNFLAKKPRSIGIFIGPEGGWTEDEIWQAKEGGAEIVSLGNTVLRGETASTIATFLVSSLN